MQPLRSRRRQFVVCGVALSALVGSLASYQWLPANEPAPAAVQQTFAVGEDLTKSVEVVVSESLRRTDEGDYFVTATVRNTSGKPLAAPLYLVVESTGVAVLKADKSAGTLETGEAVFAIREEGELAEDEAVDVRVGFKSERRLNLPELRRFDPALRVIRPAKPMQEEPQDEQEQNLPPSARKYDRQQWTSAVTGRPIGEGQILPDDAWDESTSEDETDEPGDKDQPKREARRRMPFEPGPDVTPEAVRAVMDIQDRHTPELLGIDGVAGTGTGINEKGELVLRVYAERHGVRHAIPEAIEGIPVELKVGGRFRTFDTPQDKEGRAGSPGVTALPPSRPVVDDTQQRFDRPVPIGVSGINGTIGCGTGTIGARVVDEEGNFYALSNWHVFTDTNALNVGAPILQPGPLDATPLCAVNNSDSIGTLRAIVPIDGGSFFSSNFSDAAIADVTAATLGNRTPAGGYGLPSSETAEAFLGMKVLKVGRTTGYTSGIVTGLNLTIPVGGTYPGGFAIFDDQIEIVHPFFILNPVTGEFEVSFEVFGDSGDSGSLIVSASGKNPVALLFAGNGFSTAGNPIDTVLEQLSEQLGSELRIDGGR